MHSQHGARSKFVATVHDDRHHRRLFYSMKRVFTGSLTFNQPKDLFHPVSQFSVYDVRCRHRYPKLGFVRYSSLPSQTDIFTRLHVISPTLGSLRHNSMSPAHDKSRTVRVDGLDNTRLKTRELTDHNMVILPRGTFSVISTVIGVPCTRAIS